MGYLMGYLISFRSLPTASYISDTYFLAVPGIHLKYKRNVKTREQYKRKKAEAQLYVTFQQVQEVKHLDIQISVEKETSKRVVLYRKAPETSIATLLHAVIPCIGIIMEPMIMIQHETI